MPDAFEVLKSPDHRAEPDAAFRAGLVEEMDRAFDAAMAEAGSPTSAVATTPDSVAMMESSSLGHASHRRPSRMFTLLVAAAAVTALIAAVVVARSREATAPPVNIQAPAPATTTLPFDPVAAKAGGEAILLKPSEYAPNVIQMDFKDVVLDRSIASKVPGCSAFLDTVFESPDRPAVTSFRTFYLPLPAMLSQYVVVFPTDAAAEAMFDASVDPTFHDGCFQPYLDKLVELNGVDCCDRDVAGPPALRGQPIEAADTFGADDIQLRASEDQTYVYLGEEHGPETFAEATVRVGRVVVIIEAITKDEFGDPVISDDQFHSAVATAVSKARAVLEGSPD